jgi:DNA-binding transcriptional LysR family regulator
MALDLRLMRYVIAVAEAGSFQAAAQRLHMAESPLNRQIRALERELGVDLFRRRPTQLTGPGQVFVESARRVLDAAERAVARTRLAAAGHGDVVRVGHTPGMSYDLAPRLLARLRFQQPDIRVEMHELGGAALDAALHDGQLDVGIGHGLAHLPGWTVETLRREPLGVVLGARHRLARRALVALRDLHGEPLSLVRREVAPRWYDTVVGAVVRTGARVELADDHGPGRALAGVGERRGFTLLPASAVHWLPECFVWVTAADDLGPSDLDLVWRMDAPSPAVKAVVDVAQDAAATGRARRPHRPR